MDYLNTAEVTRFTLIFLATIVMVLSFWVGTQALFPEFTRKADNAYCRHESARRTAVLEPPEVPAMFRRRGSGTGRHQLRKRTKGRLVAVVCAV